MNVVIGGSPENCLFEMLVACVSLIASVCTHSVL